MAKFPIGREESLAKWRAFVSLTAVLLLCYVPVLVTPYAFSDDYDLLYRVLRGEMAMEWATKIAQGRPTHALLLNLFFRKGNIGDLRYLRLLGVAGIIFLAWRLYRTLLQVEWSSSLSWALAVIVCTLPPFQVYASWGVTVFFPFAALASGGALSLAEWAFHERRPWYKGGLVVGAVLLLLLALTIFQPAAMFFWVFAAIRLFKPNAALLSVLRRFLWYTVIAFTGFLLGFSVYKLGATMYGYTLPPSRSHLTEDIGEKALWFFREPLLNALNLVKLFPNRWLAVGVGVFITGGLLLYLRGTVKERLCQLLIAFSLFPLSYLPNLVVAESFPAYRTLPALTAVVAVYAFFALWGYRRVLGRFVTVPILTAGLGLAALASSFLAVRNVTTYFSLPQSRELELVRSYLVQQDFSQARSIYVIHSPWWNSLAPAVRYDEFGLPSSYPSFSASSMVYILLHEIHPEHANLPIEVVSAEDTVSPPADALVVDMRKLLKIHSK
jgi:hypothetical protein